MLRYNLWQYCRNQGHRYSLLKRKKNMEIQDTIKAVRAWGIAKGITGPEGASNEKSQLKKLFEEVDELNSATYAEDHEEKIDAIGDCTVVLILMADIIGVPFEDCLETAYNVIKSRTGKMIDGAFVKDQ